MKPAGSVPTPEPEIERIAEALTRIEAHAQELREALVMGRGQEQPWRQADPQNGRTYLDAARELVERHRQCAYLGLVESFWANETVRWLENLRTMFMEGRKVARKHGERGAMRMLQVLPPPNYQDISTRAAELMKAVLYDGKVPRDAAQELTREIMKRFHGKELSADFVRQGAALTASRRAKHDSQFQESVEMALQLLDEERARKRGSTQPPDLDPEPGSPVR